MTWTNVEIINKIGKPIFPVGRRDKNRDKIRKYMKHIFARYFGLENKPSTGARRKKY